MSLPGIAGIAGTGGASSSARLSYSGTVTVGTASISFKGSGATQHGYGAAAQSVSGSSFGSRSPTTTSGFTIVGIFWESSSPSGVTQTALIVTGDSSASLAAMTVGGVNQNLGAGVYDAGNNWTSYVSGTSQANPFGADASTPAVVIS